MVLSFADFYWKYATFTSAKHLSFDLLWTLPVTPNEFWFKPCPDDAAVMETCLSLTQTLAPTLVLAGKCRETPQSRVMPELSKTRHRLLIGSTSCLLNVTHLAPVFSGHILTCTCWTRHQEAWGQTHHWQYRCSLRDLRFTPSFCPENIFIPSQLIKIKVLAVVLFLLRW